MLITPLKIANLSEYCKKNHTVTRSSIALCAMADHCTPLALTLKDSDGAQLFASLDLRYGAPIVDPVTLKEHFFAIDS